MRNNKKFYLVIFVFAAAVANFSVQKSARAANGDLIISEVLVGGNSADEEFVELYNPTSEDIDLKLLPLKLHIINSKGTTDTSKTLTYTGPSSIIKSHGYFLLASTIFKEKHPENNIGITYSAALVSNGAVYISTSADKSANVLDLVCWGTSAKCDFPLPDPKQDYGLERIANGLDWQESCEVGGTPGKASKECEKEPEPPKKEGDSAGTGTNSGTDENTASVESVYLNEILPNPKDGSDNEYIEIANGETKPVDLYKWTIRDASKTGKYVFKEHLIVEPTGFFVIYRPQSKIALNNSAESVYLYNPQGKITSSVSCDKSPKNASYNFDGETWKWSKYLTPGKKNKFDSPPTVKIKKMKPVYRDLSAEFSATAKDKETKKLKYAWDFGDGKKSYLRKTSHKYLATGKYAVTLSVSDDSQTVEKNFTLNVKNYPRPDVEIVKILPNPVGSDSEGETVDVKNNSKDKIDLNGWKIATGSGEKIYNHPVSEELIINPSKTKTITRQFSKFSLNNKAGKAALVSPDGKIIDEVDYSKEKIAEGEVYVKIDGDWQWIAPDKGEIFENADKETGSIDDPTGEKNEAEEKDGDPNTNGEVLGASDENFSDVHAPAQALFSSEDAFIFFTDIGFIKSPNTEINYCPLKDTATSLEYLFVSSI